MAKALFKVVFKVISSILSIILLPINALLVNFFPDLTNFVNAFNYNIGNVLSKCLNWFYYILPPTTKTLLLVYLGFLISYYTISYSVHAILHIFQIIKKIKFW